MSKYYAYQSILSHPRTEDSSETQLHAHTQDVINRIRYITHQNKNQNTQTNQTINTTLTPLLAHYHDIGKVTPFFQHYIRECNYNKSFPQADETMKNHSLFGAVTFFAITQESDHYTFNLNEQINGFLAILKHHSTIPSIHKLGLKYQNDKPYRNNKGEQLQHQFTAIQSVPHTADYFKNQLPDDVSLTDIEKYYSSTILQQIGQHITSTQYTNQYQQLLQYYGLLVFADKSSFEITQDELEYNTLSLQTISSYVSSELSPPNPYKDDYSSLKTELNGYREHARREALQTMSQQTHNTNTGGLYTLKLPTGFGKTIVSLSVASYIHQQKQYSNIIYGLPLTSIIDQTDTTIQEIFNIQPTDPEYTIHHYLSETISEFSSSDSVSKQQLHAESWSSELTLTTFVQLFNSLTNPSNAQSMKHANLYNNIIIIDEIQSLPIEWWGVISELFRVLIEQYNCHIISITATHPSFYSRPFIDLQPTPLVSHQYYYNFLSEYNRVEFDIHQSATSYFNPNTEQTAITPDTLATEIYKSHNKTDSTAIIQNTVKSAEKVYQTLQAKPDTTSINKLLTTHYSELYTAYQNNTLIDKLETYLTNDTTYTLLLTSNFRPIDRKIYLQILQHLLDKDTPLIATATQIFQAGVDISFNTIYRDVAPASDIVQTAGRTNRSYGQETGQVIITATYTRPEYDTDEITPHAEYIYTGTPDRLSYLQQLTPNTHPPYTETEIINTGITNYYNTLFDTHDQSTEVYLGNKQLLDAYQNGDTDTITDYPLIPTQQTIDILIPPTQEIADKLTKQLHQNIPIETIKYTHQEYIVSLRITTTNLEKISHLINCGTTNLDTNTNQHTIQDLHTCIYTTPNTYYKATGLINPTEQTQFI